MNKTKYMLAGFAVFASILMIITTCIARPVQEKTNIDAVENKLLYPIKTIDTAVPEPMKTIYLKFENDKELQYIMNSFTKNEILTRMLYIIKVTTNDDLRSRLTADFYNIIQDKEEYNNLYNYVNDVYSDDLLNIFYYMSASVASNMKQTIEKAYDGEELYTGFSRNTEGAMLLPGHDWLYPDDENWGYWLAIEDALQTLPAGYVTSSSVEKDGCSFCESTAPASDISEAYHSVNTETEDFEIVGALPYPIGSPFQNDDPVIGGSVIDGAYSSGKLTLTSDNSYTPLAPDSAMSFDGAPIL